MKKLERVILIDDDKVINFVNERTIKRANLAEIVMTFVDATETIDYMKENCHKICSSGSTILVFLDLNMPVMDGWEFLDEVKKFPNYSTTVCKIFILSSSIDPTDVQKANEYSIVQDFISKPLTTAHLEKIKEKIF